MRRSETQKLILYTHCMSLKLEKQEKLPPMVTLRKVTVEDLNEYIKLEKTLSGLTTYSSMTDEPQALEQIEKSINYFILNDRGESVGTVSYRVRSGDTVEIDGVLVKPEAEGRGYAKAALKKLIDEVRQYPHVYLMTHPDNIRSVP